MENRLLKGVRIIVIFFVIMFLTMNCSTIHAYMGEVETFQGSNSDTGDTLKTSANTIIGIVQIIGISAAVILLIVLAIKYLTAAPSEKADIKKSAIIYVVGAVLLFATTGILGIIQALSSDLINESVTSKPTGGPGMPSIN